MLLCFVSCLILFIFPRGVKISLLIIGVQQIRLTFSVLAVVLIVSVPQATSGKIWAAKATSTDLFDTAYLYYTKSDNQNGRLCAI